MTEDFFPVSFNYHGVAYEGRVSPGRTDEQGNPSSFHVVLNNVFFGYMSKTDRHWQVSEQRPAELAEMVGFCIDNHLEHLLQSEPH
jgi:hypothetical protein